MVLSVTHFRFDDYRLDATGRQLWRGTEPVDLNGRYFDALVLLVREHGQLISKDRFFEEVWPGVIVSDSALTQCIKEIRKQLGDDAAAPRYVRTVPRHGYRFVGRVELVTVSAVQEATVATSEQPALPAGRSGSGPVDRAIRDGLAGTLGGGAAGLLGGLFYGLVLAQAAGRHGVGTATTVAVFLSLGVFLGLAGGLGVSCGMALAGLLKPHRAGWCIAGAALGGLVVGGLADVLGLDAFNLIFGRDLQGITGAVEGALLGASLALGARLGGGLDAFPGWRPMLGAGMAGAVAGVAIPLMGGELFAGSLKSLVDAFAGSRLRLDAVGGLFGDERFGRGTQAMLGAVEALLFAVCVVGGLVLARRAGALRSAPVP